MRRSFPAALGTAMAVAPTGLALASVPGAALAATPGAAAHSYTGPSVNMRWGPVQVKITVSGHRVTRVSASAPVERPRSQFINQQAVPMLDREALAAQNARIHSISGATLTSRAYDSSLASALRTARV